MEDAIGRNARFRGGARSLVPHPFHTVTHAAGCAVRSRLQAPGASTWHVGVGQAPCSPVPVTGLGLVQGQFGRQLNLYLAHWPPRASFARPSHTGPPHYDYRASQSQSPACRRAPTDLFDFILCLCFELNPRMCVSEVRSYRFRPSDEVRNHHQKGKAAAETKEIKRKKKEERRNKSRGGTREKRLRGTHALLFISCIRRYGERVSRMYLSISAYAEGKGRGKGNRGKGKGLTVPHRVHALSSGRHCFVLFCFDLQKEDERIRGIPGLAVILGIFQCIRILPLRPVLVLRAAQRASRERPQRRILEKEKRLRHSVHASCFLSSPQNCILLQLFAPLWCIPSLHLCQITGQQCFNSHKRRAGGGQEEGRRRSATKRHTVCILLQPIPMMQCLPRLTRKTLTAPPAPTVCGLRPSVHPGPVVGLSQTGPQQSLAQPPW